MDWLPALVCVCCFARATTPHLTHTTTLALPRSAQPPWAASWTSPLSSTTTRPPLTPMASLPPWPACRAGAWTWRCVSGAHASARPWRPVGGENGGQQASRPPPRPFTPRPALPLRAQRGARPGHLRRLPRAALPHPCHPHPPLFAPFFLPSSFPSARPPLRAGRPHLGDVRGGQAAVQLLWRL
jgi:hypothetical protein